MLEHAGGFPIEGTYITFPGGDHLLFNLNVQSTGQSHATVFNPMVAERLGIDAKQVEHRHGDSAMEIAGYASVGSRSAMTVSHAMIKTIEALLAKGKKIAAHVLETAEADIEYRNGQFGVVGTDRRISLFDLAARAAEMKKRGEIPEDLDTKVTAETPLTFPNGCHIAEVEIDPATGALDARRLRGGRRLRQGAQPHGGRGPGPRLDRAGPRPGDDGARDLRSVGRPAHHRLVHGLRHAARRRHARRSTMRSTTCRRPPIRSASRARAKAAPPRRSRR